MAGRGKADAHYGLDDDDLRGVAKVSCDYWFMGEKVEDECLSTMCLPVLVHKFSDRWVTSHVVPKKGADPWAVKIAAHDLEQFGM